MSTVITLVLGQLNFMLGDIEANAQLILDAAARARDEFHADLIIFPELCLTGYPPEDILLRAECHERVDLALSSLMKELTGIAALVGHPVWTGDYLLNAASLIADGACVTQYYKQHLPNYGVFDEKRYFHSDPNVVLFDLKGYRVGVTICEDLWLPGPLGNAVRAGAELIVSLNASPYNLHKPAEREAILRERQQEEGACPIVYVNLVGGQDELVFDGSSLVMNEKGDVVVRAASFKEELIPVTLTRTENKAFQISGELTPLNAPIADIYAALVLATRDYVRKNGFRDVLIGLSGGIDSALTVAIACDALGSEHVHVVLMPTRFTSTLSHDLAMDMINIYSLQHSLIAIEDNVQSFLTALSDEFAGLPADVTEENIQARCRGIVMMALSNKLHKLVLTTGNKSEMAVGYSTLYGDMVGAFAVLKDIDKTTVYQLSNYCNRDQIRIPQGIIDRAPSAELRDNQTDQDTLPPYHLLDQIIALYVEQNKSIDEIISHGFDKPTVERVIALIDRNEYKRRQAAPGVRITSRAFGRDWRYPITSQFHKH